ncbi:MAG: glycosyltransferase family 9 protein [Terrimicrobiaceae bacterium]
MRPQLAVFEMHHLGDAVIALPFLRAASKLFETSVFCRPGTAALLEKSVPGLHTLARKNWLAALPSPPALGQDDVAVCVWPDSRAHFAMWRTGAGRRIGFRVAAENFYGAARPWRKRRLLVGQLAEKIFPHPLLTEAFDRAGSETHGESWARMADALGFEPDHSIPWLPLPPVPSGFGRFLEESRAAGRKILTLHPGGRLPGKRWPLELFQKLLGGCLAGTGMAVAIIKPPGEQAPAPCTPGQQVFETDSIPALAAIFAKSDGVLCNDSLASHLAAAAGAPVATIFGSGDPAWFAPHANAHLVIATNACPFRPCVDRCAMPSLVCLESVSIRLVEQKLSAMFPNSLQNPTN